MSRRVVICTEAGPEIGIGHLARDCDLALELAKDKIEISLLVHGDESLQPFIIARSGIRATFFDGDRSGADQDFFSELKRLTPDLVVVDILRREQDRDYLERCALGQVPVLTISDGEPPRDVPSAIDVRLNPNHSDKLNAADSGQAIYSGLKYFLCHPGFLSGRDEQRTIRSTIQRLLIVYGGVNFAEGVRLALTAVEQVRDPLLVRVIVSPIESALLPIKKQFSGSHHKIEFVSSLSPQEMAKEMLAADLQIGNGSNSAYEACVLGTPLVTVNMVSRQNINAAALAASDACLNLGMWRDVCPEALKMAIEALNRDPERRVRLSRRGMQAIDGKGLFRVTEIIRHALTN